MNCNRGCEFLRFGIPGFSGPAAAPIPCDVDRLLPGGALPSPGCPRRRCSLIRLCTAAVNFAPGDWSVGEVPPPPERGSMLFRLRLSRSSRICCTTAANPPAEACLARSRSVAASAANVARASLADLATSMLARKGLSAPKRYLPSFLGAVGVSERRGREGRRWLDQEIRNMS